MAKKNTGQPQVAQHRWWLALIITILSILGIAGVAAIVVIFADKKAEATQTVLTAVLPLLAAWVSTVLAYYYSSENMEAATKSVKELMSPEEKLKAIPVTEKMIKFQEMFYLTYSDDLKVQDMLDKLKASGKGYRIAFLNEKKQPQYMLHKSAVDEALVECAQKGENITKLTLKDLFEKVAGLKELAEGSFGVVPIDATLADAKAEMKGIKNAQDVFVTDNGRKDGAVIGWITNGIIEQSSRV